MLRILDGAKPLTHIAVSEGTSDIPDAIRNGNNSGVAAEIDMQTENGGFDELLVNARTGTLIGTATAKVEVEESNSRSGQYDIIEGAKLEFIGSEESNKSKWMSIFWGNPNRKKYARLRRTLLVESGGDTTRFGAVTLRIQSREDQIPHINFVFA